MPDHGRLPLQFGASAVHHRDRGAPGGIGIDGQQLVGAEMAALGRAQADRDGVVAGPVAAQHDALALGGQRLGHLCAAEPAAVGEDVIDFETQAGNAGAQVVAHEIGARDVPQQLRDLLGGAAERLAILADQADLDRRR